MPSEKENTEVMDDNLSGAGSPVSQASKQLPNLNPDNYREQAYSPSNDTVVQAGSADTVMQSTTPPVTPVQETSQNNYVPPSPQVVSGETVSPVPAKKSNKKVIFIACAGCLIFGVIIVAILGIMSASVLVAVNPKEQISKANDAASLNEMMAIQNAILRYELESDGVLPWDAFGVTPPVQGEPAQSIEGQGWMQELVDTNQIADSQEGYSNYYLWMKPSKSGYLLCFKPMTQSPSAPAHYGETGLVVTQAGVGQQQGAVYYCEEMIVNY